MDNLTSWQSVLITSWSEVWTSVLKIIPQVVGSIIVFAIGLIIAYWLRKLVSEVLKFIKLETVSKTLGIEKFLEKNNTKLTLSEILGVFAQWVVILVFFLAGVEILGLGVVSSVLAQVLSYVPNIIAAALIFGAGYFVAGLVENFVRGVFVSVDHDAAKPVGNFSRWLVLVVAFFAAVSQLKIAETLIATFFQGLTYTIVLAVGLSVGLGAKDLVSRILTDWYEKIKK